MTKQATLALGSFALEIGGEAKVGELGSWW